MKTTTILLILELLGGLFGLICAGASIASVYFLYGTWANDAPWSYPLWSFGAGFIAMLIAAALNDRRRRVDYVDQLMERGYGQAEAMDAWRTARDGGMNLLCNLRQAELGTPIELP